MAIAIREDETQAGGFAFIDLGRKLVRDPVKLSFRRLDIDPRHLARDGWQGEIAWLEPDKVDQSGATTVVRVGPAIVDLIDELVPIEIFAQGEPSLGKVTWPQLTRSPGGFGDLRIKAMTKPADDPETVHRSSLAGTESTSVPPGPAAIPAVDPADVQAVAEAAALERWQAIKDTADRSKLHRFLAEFGATRMAKQARIRLVELDTPIEPAPKRRRSPLPVLAGAAVLALLTIGVLAIAISNAGREFACRTLGIFCTEVAQCGGLTLDVPRALAFSGPQGGPFEPALLAFSLKATGSCKWAAEGVPAWLALTPSQGELRDNAAVKLTVEPHSSAPTLAPGSYETTLSFRKVGAGEAVTITRPVRIVVAPREPQCARLTLDVPRPLAFGGPQGGPFEPARLAFNLTATGSCKWEARGVPAWLELTPSQGELRDNATVKLTVEPHPSARTLAPGIYESSLSFRNVGAGEAVTITWPVRMVVAPAPCGGTTLASLSSRAAKPLSAGEECALKPKDAFKECETCSEMVVAPAGSFTMGSPESEPGRDDDEGPQHRVTISRPFAVGRLTVTLDQFSAFVRETGYDAGSKCTARRNDEWEETEGRSWRNPGFSQNGTHPAVCLNWNDAKAYAAWVSRKTGKAYRLLTEAEWEYAARAGSTTRYYFGDDEKDFCRYGNGADQTQKRGGWTGTFLPCDDGYVYTAPGGSFLPNAFGLYDMHGNARQWVEDCYQDSYKDAPSDGSAKTTGDCSRRVARGGSWLGIPQWLRSANRFGTSTGIRNYVFGFRLGRTLTP